MIGIDLVEYERFNLAVNRSGLTFLRRILRDSEMADNQESMWAVIFSAKETFIKVVGGIPPGASFQDIEIIFNSNSTFIVNTFGPFRRYVERKK